jgi:D-glycero-D-manno-heptose 1,7-bisphosphate phosphatase
VGLKENKHYSVLRYSGRSIGMQETYSSIRFPALPCLEPRPAVFIDRDGVIVEEVGYLHKVEDLRFIPGSLEAIARLNRAGFLAVEITNQAGVGRGYYGWPEFEAVQRHIERCLAELDGHMDGVWACALLEHPWRKPNPGMLVDAAARLGVALGASWMIGDKDLDVEAGARAGVGEAVLVLTGYGAGEKDKVEQIEWPCRVHVAGNLASAVDLILSAEE